MLPTGLLANLLDSGFPFHLVLDRDGRVTRVGRSLRKVVPELAIGDDHREHFEIKRPIGATCLLDVADEAVVLKSTAEKVHLRYQMFRCDQDGSLFLVGSPRALDKEHMRSLGLSTKDFAAHDAYPDYLLTLSAKDLLLGETKALTRNLKDLNATLEHRVRMRTDELSAALSRAEKASKAKSEFLATISHELRTPLNGIAGLAHLLGSNKLDDGSRELVTDLETCVEGLAQLVGDILDLARIESGALELEQIPFDTGELIRALTANVRPTLMQKGLDLHIEHKVDIEDRLVGDPTRLRQVLINLLGNAAKFTPAGRITLRIHSLDVAPSTALIRFEVEDTGIGIPPEKQGVIFQSFQQADGSTTRRFGGTGLGLSISQQLTAKMGSVIELHSEVGQGTRFWFDVRFNRAALAVPNSAERLPQVEALHALVAEDNPLNQRIIAKVLEKHGIQVTLVSNGQEALDAVRLDRSDYDLVLMDVQMPVLDGLEATRRIRIEESETGVAAIPIIALTANSFAEDRERCLMAGMDDFMAKPIQIDELLAAMKRNTQRRIWA